MLILPVKLSRHVEWGVSSTLTDVAPSLLGAAELLLVLVSNEGRLARITIGQAWLVTAATALAVEFAQLVPNARLLYRFDWLDVAATLVGVAAGALLAAALRRALEKAGRPCRRSRSGQGGQSGECT